MEQSTQTERVKKKVGRPKGTGIFSEEENKERARQRARLYYSLNVEKERKKTNRISSKKRMLFKIVLFLKTLFFNFHLNN